MTATWPRSASTNAASGKPSILRHLRYRASQFLGRQRRLPVGMVRFGDLARATPVSSNFGFDRGTPIDRYYIELFLARWREDIRGHAVEIGDNAYTLQYGEDRLSRSEVLHIDGSNPHATIVADLVRADHVPSNTFDCVILTQTLHLIYEMEDAVRTINRILKPGGTVLATVPGISPIDRGEWSATWYWSLTEHSARRVFESAFDSSDIHVQVYGNVFAAVSFLHGLALEEVPAHLLEPTDAAVPVTIGVRATKRAGA